MRFHGFNVNVPVNPQLVSSRQISCEGQVEARLMSHRRFLLTSRSDIGLIRILALTEN